MNPIRLSFVRASVATIALAASMASAQTVPISVRDAMTAAVENHGSVRIAGARLRAAEAGLDIAGAQLLPKVQLTGRAFMLSDVEQATISIPVLPAPLSLFPVITHSYAARVQVTQPVFAGFRIVNAKEAATFGAEAARADLSRDASSIALAAEKAYWGWVQAQEAHRVLDDMVRQMKEHEQRLQHMSDQGMARMADVLNVRVRRSDVEVRAIEAGTMASMAMMRLNALIGNPLETVLVPEDVPEGMIADADDRSGEDLVSRAIDTRPDLASARLRTEMARSAVAMARAGWYPTVAFAAAYEYSNPNQRIIPPKDRFDGSWEVGLTFQWTVWDWMTTSHQTAQAQAVQQQAETGYELMVDGTRLEVAQIWRTVEDSRRRLESSRLALEAAEEAFRVMEQQFDQGMATAVDVTDARIDALRARLGLSQVAAEAAIARAELRHATGERPW